MFLPAETVHISRILILQGCLVFQMPFQTEVRFKAPLYIDLKNLTRKIRMCLDITDSLTPKELLLSLFPLSL